jgi:hypothetical protein
MQYTLNTLIDMFVGYDDSEHFPIREQVRADLVSGRATEDTAAWLEREAQKRFDLPSHLPWTQIALHFHSDVAELMAYEQAHGLPTSSEEVSHVSAE